MIWARWAGVMGVPMKCEIARIFVVGTGGSGFCSEAARSGAIGFFMAVAPLFISWYFGVRIVGSSWNSTWPYVTYNPHGLSQNHFYWVSRTLATRESTFLKHVHKTVDLFINGESSVVVAPHIFGHVERQPRRPNPALRGQAALQVAPEALQAVDMGALPTTEFALVMLHQAVDVALGSDARVGGQGVGAHDGPSPDLAPNERVEGSSCEIRDDLGPDLPTAAQDAEDRRLARPSPSLPALSPLAGASIPPESPHIGFIDFHRALKDRGYLTLHAGAQPGQSPQHPLAMDVSFLGNGRGAEPADMASQQGSPLMPHQSQGEVRAPLVSASSAQALPTTDNPRSGVPT